MPHVSPSLETKLFQIENIISSITMEEVDLANEWRERLMMLCGQYGDVYSDEVQWPVSWQCSRTLEHDRSPTTSSEIISSSI